MAWREEKHPVCIAGRIVAPLCRDHARDIRPAARSRTRKTAFRRAVGRVVVSVALFSYRGSLPEVLFLICADAHRTGRSRLGNAAIAWLCLFQPFAFPADGLFL